MNLDFLCLCFTTPLKPSAKSRLELFYPFYLPAVILPLPGEGYFNRSTQMGTFTLKRQLINNDEPYCNIYSIESNYHYLCFYPYLKSFFNFNFLFYVIAFRYNTQAKCELHFINSEVSATREVPTYFQVGLNDLEIR